MPLVPLWGVWADKYSRKAVDRPELRSSRRSSSPASPCRASRGSSPLSLLLIGFQLGNTGVMLGAIRDVVPRHRIGTLIAIFGASGPIGFAVGPALGGCLVDGLGLSLSAMFWVSAGLSIATAALVWFGSREVRPEVVPTGRVLPLAFGALRGVLGDPAVRRIFAIYGVAFLANQMSRPYQAADRRAASSGTGPGLAVGDRVRRRARRRSRGRDRAARRIARRPDRLPAGAARFAVRRRARAARRAAGPDDPGPRPRRPRVHRGERPRRGDGLQPARDRGAGRSGDRRP